MRGRLFAILTRIGEGISRPRSSIARWEESILGLSHSNGCLEETQ